MVVVSDTSPIMNLAIIGRLEVLEGMYGTVFVPGAVYEELSNMARKDIVPVSIFDRWIERAEVNAGALISKLGGTLHIGEAEAIALAKEKCADLLLIDERIGRNAAMGLGLNISGLIGVLLEAKNRGIIDKIKPSLDDLISMAGFWIGDGLYQEVVDAAGER